MTIYIGNLSSKIAEDDLYEIFVEYGEVLQVNIPPDRRTGETRGFAFVDMEDDTQEAQAIIELDGAEYYGRNLRVEVARSSKFKNKQISSDYYVDHMGQIRRKATNSIDENLSTINSNKFKGNSSSTSNSSQNDGCFVSTVVYGSSEAEEVVILKQWRDRTLRCYLIGRLFIRFYYKYGYTTSRFVEKNESLKLFTKKVIDTLIQKNILS